MQKHLKNPTAITSQWRTTSKEGSNKREIKERLKPAIIRTSHGNVYNLAQLNMMTLGMTYRYKVMGNFITLNC